MPWNTRQQISIVFKETCRTLQEESRPANHFSNRRQLRAEDIVHIPNCKPASEDEDSETHRLGHERFGNMIRGKTADEHEIPDDSRKGDD